MARSWAAYILPVVLIAGGAALYWHKEGAPSPPTPPAPPPTPSSLIGRPALLGGLGPGEVVRGWTVARLRITQSHTGKPQLAIEFEQSGRGLSIWVTRKENAAKPPATTDRYAVSYGDARPFGTTIEQPTFDQLVAAIVERVRAHEATAPIPDGL